MDKALIITPTGCPMFFDPEYDSTKHWRYALPERTYETIVVSFKEDFIPEENSYDYFFHYPIRYKWKQMPELLDKFDIKWYNFSYIGIWDDDYCTDIQSVNRALELARKFDFPFFQQSLKSWTVYPCLENDPSCTKTKVIMQVHDELVFEVPEDEVEWLQVAVPTWMAGVATLKVPLLAEVGVGLNWDQAH